ncbi:HRDC domain-containing protein [Paenibacillus sp. P26]|nr:HRDC domain-containing protein [Paenibacillus sp. P26]
MFLNSLEKVTEEGGVRSAQVSIGEEDGVWHVMWSEKSEDGRTEQETWYEGQHWNELLTAFRERLLSRQADGYRPLIETAGSGLTPSDERAVYIQMLQYYAELNPNETLYESLRQWRLKQAAKEGKAPFIVATNRSLSLISVFVPQTEEERCSRRGSVKRRSPNTPQTSLRLRRNRRVPRSFLLHGWSGRSTRVLSTRGRCRKRETPEGGSGETGDQTKAAGSHPPGRALR